VRSLWITIVVSFLLSVAGAWLAELVLDERIPLFGSFLGIELSHNPGIAFGMQLPPVLQEMLIGGALIVVASIAVRSVRKKLHTPLSFGLILGGALANIADRIPDGLVTDFIQVGSFPTFNVADSSITIGVILVLVEALLSWKAKG
jgi:signal peptidase II